MADGQQRVFQVIKQPKTERQVEFPKLQNRRVLNVGAFERDMREVLARLVDLFGPAIEAANFQAAVEQSM